MEKYKLPDLPYGYKDLEPYISEETLKLHHDKHHAAYVNAANSLIDLLDGARKNPSQQIDQKSVLKGLSFAVGGHVLHQIFWETMAPNSGGEPAGSLAEQINKDFGSFERFKTEFSETAKSVEGSGWAALVADKNGSLSLMQIEKHNTNLFPEAKIILCLDVWEHAYYVDYKNDRAKFVENWWSVVNWPEAEKRFTEK